MNFLVSLSMGLFVGVIYAVTGVRSPAPPIVALAGLLGMVLGERGVIVIRQHFWPPDSAPISNQDGDRHVLTGNEHTTWTRDFHT
jgi:XapX domain-containing protein